MTDSEQAVAMDGPLPPNLVQNWESFLESGKWNRSVFADDVLFPLQRINESKRMLQIATGCNPTTVMEIGADKGGSVYLWLTRMPCIKRMIVCEVRGTPYKHLFEHQFPEVDFLWLPESSYSAGTVSRVRQWLEGSPIDVLFIDGDKSHFDTDWNLYRDLVSNYGVTFFHDINGPCPMREAWCAAATQYSGFEFIDTREYEFLKDKKPSNPYEGWVQHWKGRSCGFGVVYK